jgi:hypothetical protein
MKACAVLLLAFTLTGIQGFARPLPEGDSATHDDVKYSGEVRNFKRGNLLEVDIGGRRRKSYDLESKDTIYSLAPDLHKGSKVRIRETHNASGQKVVEVTRKE